MENERLESLIIDYIDGKLNEADKKILEQELVSNSGSRQLFDEMKEVMSVMDRAAKAEPSMKMKSSFEAKLQKEIKNEKGKVITFSPALFYRIAASIGLLAVGVSVGLWISKYNVQQEELAKLKDEMRKTKLAMMAMLDNEHSASQRVLGATVALEMKSADTEILNALVKAMNEDPNTNVRLAALEALAKFHQQPLVKKALIAALSTQKDPVVQIALIRTLVELNEKSTLKELERITTDEEMLKEVKDEAHVAIMRLS
jgi:anti-sigma factor RsiW